jgi:hypothetical protein
MLKSETSFRFKGLRLFRDKLCPFIPLSFNSFFTLNITKLRVSWDVEPCRHFEENRRFRGAYCLHHQGSPWLQVLTAASTKFRVFWDVAPCSHVEVDWRFETTKRRSTSTWLQGTTSQKTLNLILATVRTWNLTQTLPVHCVSYFCKDSVRMR